jgi:hypothetical protein
MNENLSFLLEFEFFMLFLFGLEDQRALPMCCEEHKQMHWKIILETTIPVEEAFDAQNPRLVLN